MRQHERYATSIVAVLRTGQDTIHGTVTDLSLGGAGMLTSEGIPKIRDGALDLFRGFDKVTIRARVRHVRQRPGQWKLHMQFSAVLTEAQYGAVKDLMREAQVVRILDHMKPPLAS